MNKAPLSSHIKKSFVLRWVIGLCVPLLLLLATAFLYHYGSILKCPFNFFTGFYCPGCGSGRAAYDLIHLDIIGVINHNIAFLIMLPFLAYYGLKVYISIILAKDILPFFYISYRTCMMVLIIIFLYAIIRNIPVSPWNWFAP
ncbi:MAG: hypothetical protein CVV02_02215 [Firmicutes bacterium HGW-Firmicutes-7]|nr:MAG: hypothetical protein CVV02_02215 [Firmicutes bacterium HGW-Firmicutes-7]